MCVIYIFIFSVSAGSDTSSPAQLLKSAYDFIGVADRRANLSAFSYLQPVTTFLFGIDKDSDLPPKSSSKNDVGQSSKTETSESATGGSGQVFTGFY